MQKVKIDEDGLARGSSFTLHNSLDEGGYQDYTVYGDKGRRYMDDLLTYYNEELNSTPIYKKSTGKVERDSNGNIIYRGEKFPAFNKPIRDSGKKQGKVLVKQGSRIGIVRFGDPSLRDNYSNEANDKFYARFGNQSGMNDKFSPLYWSSRWLWPRGSNKGKGPKAFSSIKKAEGEDYTMAEQDVKDNSTLIHLLQGFLSHLKPKPSLHKEDDEDEEDDDFEEELENEEDDDSLESDDDDREDLEKDETLQIVKQFDEEKMIAIEPLYINVGESDAHGDGITEEELDKMIDDFNKNIDNIKGNIHHTKMTDGFYPVKAYRLPMDVFVGNPEDKDSLVKIPEGQPIVKVQFCDNVMGKKLWEKRKSGVLRGVSIGAKGRRVANPDYQGEE
ncbi:coil containing protein [Vibrio phage 1.101.O._10N.261.45.C6]|nr:coil containing protein [Vibrio phage 1.101.O._10N.261.45.C6]